MRAVFRHELSSLFTGLIGYVFGAFLLLFTGFYAMSYNLQNAIANFEYVLGATCFVYILAVPVLTMRILSDEKKQRTDQLLYSLPLSMTKVILGKYCALLVLLVIPCLIVGLYPLILSSYGAVPFPAAYSGLTAFFLLGAALIAMGMFASSLTESLPVAAGVCFVFMLLNYYMVELVEYLPGTAMVSLTALMIVAALIALLVRFMTKSDLAALITGGVLEAGLVIVYVIKATLFEGLFPAMLNQLSVFERFYGFIYGMFDIGGVVYFLTVIGVFLFLSVQSMEKRRWS